MPLSLCSSLTDELVVLFNAAAAARNGNVLAAKFGKNCGLNKLNGDRWLLKFPLEYVDAAAAIAAAKELEMADDFVSSSSSVSSRLIDWLTWTSICDSSSTLDNDRSESIVRKASSANDALFGSTKNRRKNLVYFDLQWKFCFFT